ncbi:MAG: hypothetical protein KJ630_20585 [Proteobacteria bacterium]|nr:hypothetical protein [Pseudomonadota bacterium]
MRTFFFSTLKESCGADCRWRNCPQRYLAALRKNDGLRNIVTLGEAHSCLSRIADESPKHGDVVILYVKDVDDLDKMVSARESFEGLKKILVVADLAGADDKKYHLLEPRYITQAGRNIAELEAVIDRMVGSVN